jgi:membrane-associated protease RseP (regulator of RpoE activity)
MLIGAVILLSAPEEPLLAATVLTASLAILGFFSLSIAVFNLVPIRPLDGAIVWGLLPAFLKRLRAKPDRRKPAWPS